MKLPGICVIILTLIVVSACSGGTRDQRESPAPVPAEGSIGDAATAGDGGSCDGDSLSVTDCVADPNNQDSTSSAVNTAEPAPLAPEKSLFQEAVDLARIACGADLKVRGYTEGPSGVWTHPAGGVLGEQELRDVVFDEERGWGTYELTAGDRANGLEPLTFVNLSFISREKGEDGTWGKWRDGKAHYYLQKAPQGWRRLITGGAFPVTEGLTRALQACDGAQPFEYYD